MSIIYFLLILGIVIFVHEFGHFFVAKINGIGVVEFAIGMGPNIVSFVKGGTRYSLKWIPFGGFCRLLGQDEFLEDGEEAAGPVPEESFQNKGVWRRISVVLAGPFMNFVLALLLAILVVGIGGENTARVGVVTKDSPAQSAGLQQGDRILSINGKKIHLFQELVLYNTMNPGKPQTLKVRRGAETLTLNLTPKYYPKEQRYLIGIMSMGSEKLKGFDTLRYAFYEVGFNIDMVVQSLRRMVTGHFKLNDLGGPVAIAGMVNNIVTEVGKDTVHLGFLIQVKYLFLNLASFVVLLSANLGVMNLLPIPGLDGGRLLFLLFEAIFRKPVPKKYEGIVNAVGFALLMLLMVVVLMNDIRRLFVH